MTVSLTFLGQAGFELKSPDCTVLIDAYLTEEPRRLVRPASWSFESNGLAAILATHEHDDHLDLPAWRTLAGRCPHARFVVPKPVVDLAATAVPVARITGCTVGDPLELAEARITAVPAFHGVAVGDGYGFARDEAGDYRFLGYVVELHGVRVYHAGDTIPYDGLADRLRELRVDVGLLPINGRDAARESQGIVGNMAYDEAADLAAEARIPLVVPMHYDMFANNRERPGRFVDYVRQHHPEVTVVVPSVGSPARLNIL